MLESAEALKQNYRSLTDDELLGIATSSELTDVATSMLRLELARRNLSERDIASYREVQDAGRRADREIAAQRTMRSKVRLKLHAYLLAATSTLVLLFGLGLFVKGDRDQGTSLIFAAAALVATSLVWLGLKWKFYDVMEQRLRRAIASVEARAVEANRHGTE